MTTSDMNPSNPDAAQLIREGLETAWRKYLTELKRCRSEFSNEAVHDLRVATRRMLAIIRLLQSVSPRPRLQKTIRTLKEQLDEFDALRDTQVILAEISKTIQELPELQTFQKQQQRHEDKLFRKVRKKVRKFNTQKLSRRVHKIHDFIQAEGVLELKSNILRAVDDAYGVTTERLASVDLTRPVTIHRVRVAFKTFRYMVETIHPLLADFPETNLKSMHDYQSLMGEVQDAEVMIQTLSDFSGHAASPDAEQVHRYYERRHAEAISAYAAAMNVLHAFWRSAPDGPFPWGKFQ